MSRVSQKSRLSPSITKSSNGIDLGKNSGVDMGRKTEPSLTSGGIGIRQEVTNVGGMSVTGGIEVDLTPIDFGINIDPSQGTISVATGAEIPGGLLGVSGGIEVDLNTGEIIGGSIGGEVGGLGINLSNSKKGGLGIEFTLQIPGTPIELSLGFGFPPNPQAPSPGSPGSPGSPTPSPLIPSPPSAPFPPLPLSPGNGGTGYCTVVVARKASVWGINIRTGETEYYNYQFANGNVVWNSEPGGLFLISGRYGGGTYIKGQEPQSIITSYSDVSPNWRDGNIYSFFGYGGLIGVSGGESAIYGVINRDFAGSRIIEGDPIRFIAVDTYDVIYSDCPASATPPPTNPPAPSPTRSPFPNPPPRRQNRMDACCRENLKFLRAIYTGLGIAKFPGQLPATIIQKIAKEGEAPAEPPQVPIADFVDLLDWQFRRDDERWGQWEIQINVKDGDLTKEGDQGKQIKFPNLAESIAELEGQMLSILANVEALVALSVRNLSESGMARQEAIKGYLASMAIAKYMAFPYEEIDIPIPSTYTPGATSIDKLIIESIVHAKGIDYKNKETLRDILLDLLQSGAITRAVHWRQVDPKSDIKKQILSQLKGSAELSEKITNVKAESVDGDTNDKRKESWEDKLDQYENGFGFVTGIEDANTPYGRDRERRPRIRQIGDNIAQAGKNE